MSPEYREFDSSGRILEKCFHCPVMLQAESPFGEEVC